MQRQWASLLGLSIALVCGCGPKFESSGSITVDGSPFQPTTCQVLPQKTGIELSDANGALLELTLPPAQLRAFEDINGQATVRYKASQKEFASVGECGPFTMHGEGWHGSGKRAVSGHASLSCSTNVNIQGTLTFKDCF